MLKLMTKVQKSPKLQIVKKHILVGMWFARWSRRWELREREKEDMGLMKKEAKTEKKKVLIFIWPSLHLLPFL